MGDRVYTTILFAGVIDEENVEDLLEAVNADGLTCDDGPELTYSAGSSTLVQEHLQYQLYNCECNYASLDETEAACHRLGVNYLKTWQEGGDFAPGMEIYNAITGVTLNCGLLDGEPAVTLSDLEKAGSPEDLIGFLKAFSNFEKNYGTLDIKLLDETTEAAA